MTTFAKTNLKINMILNDDILLDLNMHNFECMMKNVRQDQQNSGRKHKDNTRKQTRKKRRKEIKWKHPLFNIFVKEDLKGQTLKPLKFYL